MAQALAMTFFLGSGGRRLGGLAESALAPRKPHSNVGQRLPRPRLLQEVPLRSPRTTAAANASGKVMKLLIM